jgi:hypothetical protein
MKLAHAINKRPLRFESALLNKNLTKEDCVTGKSAPTIELLIALITLSKLHLFLIKSKSTV